MGSFSVIMISTSVTVGVIIPLTMSYGGINFPGGGHDCCLNRPPLLYSVLAVIERQSEKYAKMTRLFERQLKSQIQGPCFHQSSNEIPSDLFSP